MVVKLTKGGLVIFMCQLNWSKGAQIKLYFYVSERVSVDEISL